jgi:hypothetical protein
LDDGKFFTASVLVEDEAKSVCHPHHLSVIFPHVLVDDVKHIFCDGGGDTFALGGGFIFGGHNSSEVNENL